ncbi:orotidine-5'-phosphate decarboxylase [bacterium]|nr:orotidine-5'-phosphate decarboxylase [bacterium]
MATGRNCFFDKLKELREKGMSPLVVGIDPRLDRMPEAFLRTSDPLYYFSKAVVDGTAGLLPGYKINIAFFGQLGYDGFASLKRVLDYIPNDMYVILDAKCGDIGSTSCAYAKAIFDYFGADATTVNPYLGEDALVPFFEYRDKGVFVLCLTSNPGASDFQYLSVDGVPLYLEVARKVSSWNEKYGNIGLVVGATYPDELSTLREEVPELVFLTPGIGAQGGDLEAAIRYGITKSGILPVIPVSRAIIYPEGEAKYSELVRERTLFYIEKIDEQIALLDT